MSVSNGINEDFPSYGKARDNGLDRACPFETDLYGIPANPLA